MRFDSRRAYKRRIQFETRFGNGGQALCEISGETFRLKIERELNLICQRIKFNSRFFIFYSNRVAVEVEQPVAIKVPFAAKISTVPVEVKSLPPAPSVTVCLTLVTPAKVPSGLKRIKVNAKVVWDWLPAYEIPNAEVTAVEVPVNVPPCLKVSSPVKAGASGSPV